VSSMFHRLTGAASRHNKALDEVNDWAARMEKFLVAYGLDRKDHGAEGLLGSSGDAKFDLTGLAYTGRRLEGTARDIRDKRVGPALAATVENVEGVRRCLMKPSLHMERLAAAIGSLSANLGALKVALMEIEKI
jgi:hypothetical protein